MEDQSNTLVTVLTASLIHEIHIAKTLLSSYNINSFIFDENIATTMGTAFVEGYKLKVSTLDFEKAQEILNKNLSLEN
ncbi:putative signal transducing protein [Lutibacter sp.]